MHTEKWNGFKWQNCENMAQNWIKFLNGNLGVNRALINVSFLKIHLLKSLQIETGLSFISSIDSQVTLSCPLA